jgi:hypothetical protein
MLDTNEIVRTEELDYYQFTPAEFERLYEAKCLAEFGYFNEGYDHAA